MASVKFPNSVFSLEFILPSRGYLGFPGGSDCKESACNAGDSDLIPGLERSPGEGNGNLLQYSCLENPMDRGDWWATVHGVAKSRIRLMWATNTVTFTRGYLATWGGIFDCHQWVMLVAQRGWRPESLLKIFQCPGKLPLQWIIQP